MRKVLVTLTAALFLALVGAAFSGGPRVEAQASPSYSWQHWVIGAAAISDHGTTVSGLTLTLNGIAADGWEITQVFPTPNSYTGGTDYNVIGRRITGVAPIPAPTPTTAAVPTPALSTSVTCPGGHPGCTYVPAGTYDRTWMDSAFGWAK